MQSPEARGTMRARAARAKGYDRLGEMLVKPVVEPDGKRGNHRSSAGAGAAHGGWRCPYLKTSISSSVALVAAVLLLLTGAQWLSGSGSPLRHSGLAAGGDAEQTAAGLEGARGERPLRGKRSRQKQKATWPSSFRHSRVAATSTAVDADSAPVVEEPSGWVWVSQADIARGFSLLAAEDGALSTVDDIAETLVLPLEDEQCAEGWALPDCLQCAPGFEGDFCERDAAAAAERRRQEDLYNSQLYSAMELSSTPLTEVVQALPHTAEIHLRDYLPGVQRQAGRGSERFSAGVNIVAAGSTE
jgi:hypothetical protein